MCIQCARLTPNQMSEIMHCSIKTVGDPRDARVLTGVVLTAGKVLKRSKTHTHPPTHTQSCQDKSIFAEPSKRITFHPLCSSVRVL